MTKLKDVLAFTALLTNLAYKVYENGMVRAIVMTLPNFTTATKVNQIDILDEDGNAIYTNTNGGAGWAENATYLITNLAIPVDKEFQFKMTLDAAAGGTHDTTVKLFVESM